MPAAAEPRSLTVIVAMAEQLRATLGTEAYHLRGTDVPSVQPEKPETNLGSARTGGAAVYLWWVGSRRAETGRLAVAGVLPKLIVGVAYRGYVWGAGRAGEVQAALARLDHDVRHGIATDPGLGCAGTLAEWQDSSAIYEPGKGWGEINGRFDVLAGETWEV